MAAPLAAYLVAFAAMLFAGISALTLFNVVSHLDPPEVQESKETREAVAV